jgi:hypothetical protein
VEWRLSLIRALSKARKAKVAGEVGLRFFKSAIRDPPSEIASLGLVGSESRMTRESSSGEVSLSL